MESPIPCSLFFIFNIQRKNADEDEYWIAVGYEKNAVDVSTFRAMVREKRGYKLDINESSGRSQNMKTNEVEELFKIQHKQHMNLQKVYKPDNYSTFTTRFSKTPEVRKILQQ